MEKQELRNRTAELLALIWRGIPVDFKSRYRMTIWAQFENEIRSAAYTNNLAKFINSLCSRLSADVGRNATERERANALLAMLDDRATLKMLREETILLVLMVRVANQERRDEWEALHSEGD